MVKTEIAKQLDEEIEAKTDEVMHRYVFEGKQDEILSSILTPDTWAILYQLPAQVRLSSIRLLVKSYFSGQSDIS